MLRRLALIALVVLAAGGCGTVMNVAVPTHGAVALSPDTPAPAGGPPIVTYPPERRVYGGVDYDLKVLKTVVANRASAPLNLVAVPAAAIELPLSAVGDTLTLPLTLRRLIRARDTSGSNEAEQRDRTTKETNLTN